ncbi:hypothetical protein [Hymenobacter properus]|uniref:Uncharacterized protein n=1 Tax=Hymenobacter properus TaxID=2791026 RepID=A0A931BGU2_9BACT|nr:hypothetical protein [Hymenobacter properus]MBF9142191.1 hypothetical protein [Hymenobacter properus]MBR7720998.1 hypothetical protein [Microvirga sp. SRT04]
MTITFNLLMIGVSVFSWFYKTPKQARLFESMLLTVNEQGVTRTQLNTPTKHLNSNEIVRIEHFPTGEFVIKGANKLDTVWMPAQVEAPQQLAQELQQLGPVLTPPAPAWYKSYASLLGLLMLPLLYFFITSSNKIVAVVLGTVSIGSVGYSYWLMQRSKDIDQRLKRYSHLSVLVLVWLVALLVSKLLPG